MPNEPVKACIVCGAIVPSGEGYKCKLHRKESEQGRYASRKGDPVEKLYNAQWRKLKNFLLMQGNVMCQRIVNGQQCDRLGEIWHHLVSPRLDPTRMYAPKNLVHVCRDHHSDVLQDDPSLYVPTKLGILGDSQSE